MRIVVRRTGESRVCKAEDLLLALARCWLKLPCNLDQPIEIDDLKVEVELVWRRVVVTVESLVTNANLVNPDLVNPDENDLVLDDSRSWIAAANALSLLVYYESTT